MTAIQNTMIEICDRTVKDIIKGGRWVTTEQTRTLENDVLNIYREALAGRRGLADFRAAVQRWKMEGTR